MSITASELKANLGKYLLLAMNEDILITQYGKVIAKLSNPFQSKVEIAESLFGVLPQTTTWEEAREVCHLLHNELKTKKGDVLSHCIDRWQ